MTQLDNKFSFNTPEISRTYLGIDQAHQPDWLIAVEEALALTFPFLHSCSNERKKRISKLAWLLSRCVIVLVRFILLTELEKIHHNVIRRRHCHPCRYRCRRCHCRCAVVVVISLSYRSSPLFLFSFTAAYN